MEEEEEEEDSFLPIRIIILFVHMKLWVNLEEKGNKVVGVGSLVYSLAII